MNPDNPIVSAFDAYNEAFGAFNEAWTAFQLAMRCARSATPEAQTEAQTEADTLVWQASEAVDATSATLASAAATLSEQLAESNGKLRKGISRKRLMSSFTAPEPTN